MIAELLKCPEVAGHREFCDQIRAASSSAPANIAEGFWRFRPREFARFVRIALGSLGETQNHLRRALRDEYITQDDFDEVWSLSFRAIGASTKQHAYLRKCPDRR